jgi:hypothetical protein
MVAKVVQGPVSGLKPTVVARVVAATPTGDGATAPSASQNQPPAPTPVASFDAPTLIREPAFPTDASSAASSVANFDSEPQPDKERMQPGVGATETAFPDEAFPDFSSITRKASVSQPTRQATRAVPPAASGMAASGMAAASPAKVTQTASQKRALRAAGGSLVGRLPKWWPAVVVGLVILLGGGAWWMFSGSGKTSPGKSTAKKGSKKKSKSHDAEAEEADVARGDEAADSSNGDAEPIKKSPSKSARGIRQARSLWEVGPSSEFKTLSAALADMRKRQDVDVDSNFRVQIAAGATLNERVVIEDATCPGISITVTGGEATLNAPGSEPAIEINSTKERLRTVRIEGLKINASGRDVAVRVTGSLVAFRMAGVSISGFSVAGVEAVGVRGDGNKPWTIERCRFLGAESSRGIVFKKGIAELASVQVSRNRFIGPMAAGIRIEESAVYVDLIRNLFHETTAGIELVGEGRDWRTIQFLNNTFHKNRSGVAFTNQPGAGAHGIVFYNNLFLGSSGPDVVVQNGYDAVAFQRAMTAPGGAVIGNWTDSSSNAASKPGAVDLFSVNDNRSAVKRDELMLVETTDAESEEFLQPTPLSPLNSRGIRRDNAGPGIGALPLR